MNTPSLTKSLPLIYAADEIVQDLQTSRKVKRLFELLSLHLLPPSSISVLVTNSDTYHWHLRLGHASSEKLCHLISVNNLNNVTSTPSPTPFNKIGVLSVNFTTFLTQYVPSFFLPHVLRNFGVKQFLNSSIPSIIFLLLFFRTSLHRKSIRFLFLGSSFQKTLNISPCHILGAHYVLSLVLFHTSFFSPHPFFIDTSVELFSLSESTPNTELAQFAPAPTNSNESSVSYEGLEPTPDTHRRHSTRWPLLQMDVKNDFLNGTLFKEVYMKPPLSTSPPPHKVPHDTALFTCHTPKGIVLLLLYVDDMIITGYSNTDWARDPTDRRSTIEYRVLLDTIVKLLWLHWLFSDMSVPQQGPTLLRCDKCSVIQIAYNDVFHESTKHIENDCYFICHHLLSNTLILRSVSTIEQAANILTKVLPSNRFNQLLTKLKLIATLPP
ncbi:putative mitochondrial protein [Cucumis melo var. makuwa]|uniref:Mitochondrial protein n=1 Tax=Cucumis melo var. makuwa TaxID=1194695 RepID=A0A5D3DU54_CUCMM|nr:putative mitochondrial protein [Cucumis melo var. makuwa]TYK27028.1 putative mitochondrial protein [Cucumis melo var. makuwa]